MIRAKKFFSLFFEEHSLLAAPSFISSKPPQQSPSNSCAQLARRSAAQTRACRTLIWVLCVVRLSPGLWCSRRAGRGLHFLTDMASLKPSRRRAEDWRQLLRQGCSHFVCLCFYVQLRGGESQPLSQDQTLQWQPVTYRAAWSFISTVVHCLMILWYGDIDIKKAPQRLFGWWFRPWPHCVSHGGDVQDGVFWYFVSLQHF